MAVSTGRSILFSKIKEREWQSQVEAWAKRAGWLRYHTRLSMGSGAGFPDLCLVRPPRVVFIECKTQTGKLSKAQVEWLAALGACPGVESYMFRPADDVEVKSVLGLLAGGRDRAGATATDYERIYGDEERWDRAADLKQPSGVQTTSARAPGSQTA